LVTLRAARGIPSLRSDRLFLAVWTALAHSNRPGFRVIHFSVQHDHLHAVVEAASRIDLIRGMRGLAIRIALSVKSATGGGKVWDGRGHRRALTCPRQMRNALVYVLLNFRKHLRAAPGIDPCSSGPWFDGWAHAPPTPVGHPPTARPRTWLATAGWRRAGGAIRVDESPRLAPTARRAIPPAARGRRPSAP
jgi:hypothetical protein